MPADGPCVFTGRTAIYFGAEPRFDDRAGHVMTRDQPLAVCDKTAGRLSGLGHPDLLVTPPTWSYADGGGCCQASASGSARKGADGAGHPR